jgi:hypothetical protein
MPVMVIDVPVTSWNEVVVQSVLFGLDMMPDVHRDQGPTIVEITGTWDKLNSALTRIQKKAYVDLLAVMESKELEIG